MGEIVAASRLEHLTKRELIERLRSLESPIDGEGDSATRESSGAPTEQRPALVAGEAASSSGAANHYADLYAFAPVGCLSLDACGRIAEINLKGAAMLGWERAWLLGQSFSRWIAKDDSDRFSEHLRGVKTARGTVVDELRIKERHGRTMEVRLESVAIMSANGGSISCQSVMIDITSRRRVEREARLLQAQLAHVARLNTMGEIASSLAHELNQPLGTIALYCDTCLRMIRTGAKVEHQLIEALEQASEAAQHAGEIIRHLRGFLRKGDGQRIETALDRLIPEVVRLVEPEARDQGGTVELRLAERLPKVTIDPVHIEQVLVNLLRNGIEAMTSASALVRKLTISTAARSDGKVQVSVQDTGPGLRAAVCSRVFDAFYTTKPDGMGMGLPISRSIVEAHGGRLWAEPGIGAGAIFHLVLPVTGSESHGATADRLRDRR